MIERIDIYTGQELEFLTSLLDLLGISYQVERTENEVINRDVLTFEANPIEREAIANCMKVNYIKNY